MSKENSKTAHIKLVRWQKIAFCLAIYDILAIHLCYFLALFVRFDLSFSAIPMEYRIAYLKFITAYSIGAVIVFHIVRMYRFVWRYVSFNELLRIGFASIGTSIVHSILITACCGRMPLSYHLWGALLQLIALTAPRVAYRLFLFFRSGYVRENPDGSKIMIIGAGQAGQMLLRDIHISKELKNDTVVCFIDDNSNKWGRFVEGVPVAGGRDSILETVKKYKVDKIFIALPTANMQAKRDIINICNESGCEIRQLPGLHQLVLGEVTVNSMKPVSVEDLLGREPIQTDMKEVFKFINDKVVMVTGGGGSIGSELCRQVAEHHPKQLIIFDVYENSAYAIQLELKNKHPDLNLVVLIGSVRDSRRMFEVFDEYRPQIVYHAAAHKHVPLMEDSPNEAIKNNALGTYKTAYAAMMHGCERFVLISTDKAVNPTNIMGASKRICEMIIQSFDAKIKAGKANEIPQLFTHVNKKPTDNDDPAFKNIKTEFVAVRFGNVLGSNGSVIPIFKKQIEQGGPVTVTHPDIIRYFMTIKEAVSLVMQAGTFAHGGEIFVLDMGSPVKIDTLARNLIRLSGFKPDEDIKIVYSGLRPGEKLYEEKLMAEEGLKKTDNDLIHIGCPIAFDTDEFLKQLGNLMEAAYNNKKDIRDRVAFMVSTYHPDNSPVYVVKENKYAAMVVGEDN